MGLAVAEVSIFMAAILRLAAAFPHGKAIMK